jgi:kynurenine formamidase
MTAERTLSLDETLKIYEQIKAWGRWGADDQRGALNYISREKRRQAAGLVQEGITVSASLPLNTVYRVENNLPVMHLMVRAGDIADAEFATDYFAIASHGIAHTHLDALCHFYHNGLMYNGYPQASVTSMGATVLSIEAGADGIASRGILLDIPRLKGRDWLEPGEPIYIEDLERAEERAGVRVEEGDILLVRTGRHARNRATGPKTEREPRAGLHTSCLPWLSDRRIALLGCDGTSDVSPARVEGVNLPVHVGTLVYMGVHLLDNADLEALGDTCAEMDRWEFLLTLNPLKRGQGTASPVNPVAML